MNSKKKKDRNKSFLLGVAVLALFGASFMMLVNVSHADSYGNYANTQVYATDIFGAHMAWVNNNWNPFATYTGGDFQNNINTQLVTNGGGVWPDGGSIAGSSSWESSTVLSSSVDYSLNSVLGQHFTGTLVNEMVYNGNGNYENYAYVYGTSSYYSTGGILPISFDIPIDV